MTESPENLRPRSRARQMMFIAVEIFLVAVILGLLIATWLPAMIGANPDAPHFP